MALEYLAKQQGEQQILINELLGKAPGAKITDYQIRTQQPSQIDLGELDADGQGVTLSMDAGIPRTGDKQFEDDEIRDGMQTPLQQSAQANRIAGALQEKIDKLNVMVQDQENRMIKVEHQNGVSVDGMKKGKLSLR